MTQKSIPWPGVSPANGPDAGRYLAPEWWAIWATMQQAGGLIIPAAADPLRTISDWTNIGVYYGVENRLEVTDAGGFVAEVDTGAALVDGQYYYNDEVVELTMPASQTYYVVLRKNFTAATYTPPGYAAGAGTVPAYATRITWVSAAVQSTDRTTYWDIPLATVVTDGAEITSVTDTREWVDAETKYLFIPCHGAYNSTGATEIDITSASDSFFSAHHTLQDNDESIARAMFRKPSDYIDDLTFNAVFERKLGGAGTAIYGLTWYHYVDCAGQFATTGSGDAFYTETIPTSVDYVNCKFDRSITDDTYTYFGLVFERNAVAAQDTLDEDVAFYGFGVSYLGWK